MGEKDEEPTGFHPYITTASLPAVTWCHTKRCPWVHPPTPPPLPPALHWLVINRHKHKHKHGRPLLYVVLIFSSLFFNRRDLCVLY